MGGLLHLLDYNWGSNSMARKMHIHKRPVDGLEAPQNSLDLQVETSQHSLDAENGLLIIPKHKPCSSIQHTMILLHSETMLLDFIDNNVDVKCQYSLKVKEDWSQRNSYPIEASMKMLINEEIYKQSKARKNSPSIVAQLMGVDTLPVDKKSVIQPTDRKNESTKSFSKKEKNAGISDTHFASNTNSSRHVDLKSYYSDKGRETDSWSNGQKLGKPRRREHPQEEELQKFKKEFEAWQAARFKECSKAVELGGIPDKLLAAGDINGQKVVTKAYLGLPASQKPVEHKGFGKKERPEKVGLQLHKYKMEQFPVQQKDSTASRKHSSDLESIYSRNQSSLNCDQKLNNSSASTRIVLLKPVPYRVCHHEVSWTSSSGTLEDRGSIEDLLEDVKERLESKLEKKALRNGCVVRGNEIETQFGEKPLDPKKIAQHIAKQVRESVTHDIRRTLLRSESTRSSRSEILFNGPGSPEFIDRNTRRFLPERQRNVLNSETHYDVPLLFSCNSRSSGLDIRKSMLKRVGETSKTQNGGNYWEIAKAEEEMQTRSFRHGDGNGMLNKDLSPRNLIRSLSAPVSGTSLGKLLLEDRHILTGAHIRRKHEVPENVTVELKKQKKERFSIKETVSNLRYSFTLKGRLFRKKKQSMAELYCFERDLAKDIMSGPTVATNFGDRRIMENSTEVPPSPASVCSNSQEEFWKPADYLSPVLTPDAALGEDNAMPQVFGEISSNLNELRRQLNQPDSEEPGDTTIEHEHMEFMVDIKDKAEAYIRDLLVASGLYDRSSERCLQRWDPFAKTISNSIFDEVEESWKRLDMGNETAADQNEKKVDRKVVFDLLNESLSSVLESPITMSRFRRKTNGSSMLPIPLPLQGKKLLECVWEMIREYVYPPDDKSAYYSLDNMVARNLGSTPWSAMINDEVNGFGKEMECLIMGDLVEETLKDMHQ